MGARKMIQIIAQLLLWLCSYKLEKANSLIDKIYISDWFNNNTHSWPNEARFLIAAAIDEVMPCSNGIIYKTFADSTAGITSYYIIDSLLQSKKKSQVLWIAYMLLMLGYEGQYDYNSITHTDYCNRIYQCLDSQHTTPLIAKKIILKPSLLIVTTTVFILWVIIYGLCSLTIYKVIYQ